MNTNKTVIVEDAAAFPSGLRVTNTEYEPGITTTIATEAAKLPAGTYWLISDEARAAIAELLAADREYDAAQDAVADAKADRGRWSVNPLPHDHPALLRLRIAGDVRCAALAACGVKP